MHTCIHTCIHTYIHAYIHTCIHTYIPSCVCRYNIYFCFIINGTQIWAYLELYVFRSPRAHYDLNKSFEHVQNDLIARGAHHELSAIARDIGGFFMKDQAANKGLLTILRICEQELTTTLL